MAANIKNVTELDFDQIKDNLKAFLSTQDKFADYDFDGSSLNILLDVLSYNTQYNAMLAHMNANEAFLDSAQRRSNVVSHAKSLGYVPSSARASTAYLNVYIKSDSTGPAQITMPKGTVFTGLIGTTQYTFVTNQSYTVSKSAIFDYTFSVEAKQGSIKTNTFRVDGNNVHQKFTIPDTMVDTTTLLVRVRPSVASTTYTTYTHYGNIVNLTADSKVYFVQENANGEYEVYFGDGVIGYKPAAGSIVEIAYVSTVGSEGNGAKTFSINSTVNGLTVTSVTNSTGFTRTQDGADKEAIDSIRFNAPRSFASQNRAVTATDYATILKSEYDFIEDVSIWGGEINVPPVYGKVYISVKPYASEYLSQVTKQTINNFLSTRNIGSVTAEIVDPNYTFLAGDIFFKYNPNATTRTQSQLEAAVRTAVFAYNDKYLEKFDGVLRFSKLLEAIDDVDPGIMNSYARLTMHKHLMPIQGVTTDYKLQFCSGIYITDSAEVVMSSSTFTYAGSANAVFTDVSDASDLPNRTVKIIDNITKAVLLENAGKIFVTAGRIELTQIKFESSAIVKIFAEPESRDIAPKFNQLVSIESDDTPGITVTGEVDLIATLGAVGAASYTTFSRHN